MQDDMSKEKSDLLEQLGATVERVRPASIISSENFVRLAEKRARAIPNAVFANQFENLANFRAHYETTGPEIWKQCCGKIDAVVMAAGTGGTIAGVSRFLKEKNPKIKVYLIDPPGSSLFNKVKLPLFSFSFLSFETHFVILSKFCFPIILLCLHQHLQRESFKKKKRKKKSHYCLC